MYPIFQHLLAKLAKDEQSLFFYLLKFILLIYIRKSDSEPKIIYRFVMYFNVSLLK
jgi:hypothetical protein